MKEITTTKKAFAELIAEPASSERLGVARSRVSEWKAWLRGDGGKAISLEKMEELLEKAGAVVVQEKVWRMPEKKKKS